MPRQRRTKAEMATIRDGLIALAEQHGPATVRQCFYLAIAAGLIDKTEQEYKGTVCRLLADARIEGDLSWSTIVDHTRSALYLKTADSLADAVADTARHYRRAMWRNQEHRVEIWIEKQTLMGVLRDVTMEFDVGLFATRGYPSLSFLYDCAEDIQDSGKPTFIYFLGDHDPSGRDIRRNVEARLREFTDDADIVFEHLAVTPEQIREMSLPVRPTKTTDTRAKGWQGGSVEVEAITPDKLRNMVTNAIVQHIDDAEWRIVKAAEQSERELLNILPRGRFEEMQIMGTVGQVVLPFDKDL